MKTAAVISYSSYHNPFILKLIEEAKKFVSGEIMVVCFDKFFDGKPDTELLDLDMPQVRTLKLEYDNTRTSRWHHNHQRKAGYDALDNPYDAVFFLDSDEVPIGDKMKLWLEAEDRQNRNYRFASFWYYRDTCWQAHQLENSFAMVSAKSLESAVWYHDAERETFATNWERMEGHQHAPLAHHYSWAGTKEMLLRKVRSWGHNKDMDWVSMIEADFEHDFEGCPFREHYTFQKVTPFIGFSFND